jgi:short-subunit dehydrogenase
VKKMMPGLVAAAGLGCLYLAQANGSKSKRRFADKVVVITGSSRGLGFALAQEFAREGALLVLAARDHFELEAARKLLEKQEAIHSEQRILTISCDLREEAEARQLITGAIERFGRVDVLVNNAGVMHVGPVENQPIEAFTRAVETNYYSAVYTTLAALPGMLTRGEGSIVNICSIGGKVAVPHLLPYSGSKFALVGFSQGLHAELRSKGIRVTTVCPGLMRTGSHVQALFTGDREREYRWFSLLASLPGISASAKSAAKKIVRATARGAAEIAITPQAALAARLVQAAPGSVAAVLSIVNDWILPRPADRSDQRLMPGSAVSQKELTFLTAAGRSATYRYNQVGSMRYRPSLKNS